MNNSTIIRLGIYEQGTLVAYELIGDDTAVANAITQHGFEHMSGGRPLIFNKAAHEQLIAPLPKDMVWLNCNKSECLDAYSHGLRVVSTDDPRDLTEGDLVRLSAFDLHNIDISHYEYRDVLLTDVWHSDVFETLKEIAFSPKYYQGQPELFSQKFDISQSKIDHKVALSILCEIALKDESPGDASDVALLLGGDGELTRRVLIMANSAFYGGAVAATSLEQVVSRIGRYRIMQLVLSSMVSDAGRDSDDYFIRTFHVASMCKAIAVRDGLDANQAFIVGILGAFSKIVGKPLAELTTGMELSEDIKRAFFSNDSILGNIVKFANDFENLVYMVDENTTCIKINEEYELIYNFTFWETMEIYNKLTPRQ